VNVRLGLGESLAAYLRDAEAMRHVHRLAERHGRLPRDSIAARELVSDVIGDMYTGDVRCHEGEIGPQVERHVVRRAKRLRKANRPRSQRRDAAHVEVVPLEKAPVSALLVDPFGQAREHDEDDAPDPAELITRIRDQARDDGAVLQLLALAEQGIVLRRDVLCAGMSPWAYRGARERLTMYAEGAMAGASASYGSEEGDSEKRRPR
jgi:hypothetical protein